MDILETNYKNGEGYDDPTCGEAIKNIEKSKARFNKMLRTIHNICDLAGFEIKGRVIFIDKKSGHIWK